MNKFLLIGFILLSSIVTSTAQIPKEAFNLTNSLSDLWTRGKTEEAVQKSLRLYKLYPPFLFSRFNTSLSQHLKRNNYKNASIFIEQLYQQSNQNLNRIIKPMYLWSKAIRTNDADSVKEIIVDLSNTFNDSMRYWSKAETYCLLTLNSVEPKKLLATQAKAELVYKVIQRLESHPFLNIEVTGKVGEEKAWCKFLLAYSYYYLYSKVERREEFLRKASDYSPDIKDRLFESGYFYDAFLLIGGIENITFKSIYQNYLLTNGRKSESLYQLSEIAFENPSDSNIQVLSTYYNNLFAGGSFKKYWEDYLGKKGTPFPALTVQFENDTLDFSRKPGKWIFIDVWGTWCGPCVEELPKLQSFFIANRGNDKLKIYTFSYGSRSLKGFMKKKNYSFPVSEIDKEVKELLHITGFPTKILISPDGNYFEIPFGKDWRMYLKNYTGSSI